MIKGHYEERYDKNCTSIYLYDKEKGEAYTFQFAVHKIADRSQLIPSTDLDDPSILRGLADALQKGGILPQSAVDAELKATKYHLEDMRKLTGISK